VKKSTGQFWVLGGVLFYTLTVYNNDMTDTFTWTRMEDEDLIWYERFIRFYLPLGTTRTLFQAYKLMLSIEDPEKLDSIDNKNSNTPAEWSKMADKYHWLERAMAYDEKMYSDGGAVELAREFIKNSSFKAAQTLEAALNNPRLMVAAAKEILDRSGVLAASINLNKDVEFTADEMAEAMKDVDEWTKNVKNG